MQYTEKQSSTLLLLHVSGDTTWGSEMSNAMLRDVLKLHHANTC